VAAEHRANNFNLIRLVLASSVILAHSPEIIDGNCHREPAALIFGAWTSLGDLAVDGFFILSGYLIAQSWISGPRLFPYLWKRALRIYPGFLAASLLSGLVLAPLGTEPHYWQFFSRRWFAKGLITLATPRVPPAFPGFPYPYINGPIWTIQYEFACYLTLGILGLLGLLGRRWVVLGGALIVTSWAAAQLLGLVAPIPPDSIVQREDEQIPRLLSCFLAGSVFFLFRDHLRFNRWMILGSGVTLVLAMLNSVSGTILLPWLGGYLLLAAGNATVVPGTNWVRRDDISYGVYLYAWPIQMLLLARLGVRNPWLLFAITLPIAMLAGWISWRLIEKPPLRWKNWRWKRSGSTSSQNHEQQLGRDTQ